jgi:aminopeptidase N
MAAPDADGLAPAGAPAPAAAIGDIVPGSVGRSSPFLDATYDAYLALAWDSRNIYVDSTATIRNTWGRGIDRVELNTIAARLGRIRLEPVAVDGHAVAAQISDQTIVVPLGGVLPPGGTARVRVRYHATLRSGLAGSDWLFTRANGVLDLYRWLPWVSRRIAFTRPNHGDPFETPLSRSVRVKIVTSRRLVLATTGERTSVSANGLTQSFTASNVRDFTVTAATDYRTASRVVRDSVVRVYYRPGAPGAAMLDAAADAFDALERRLGSYPHRTFRVVQSAGGYGMESPGLIWIPTGVAAANLRYLAAHETAHQWFYGMVGNDQAAAPFADEAAADFAARSILGLRRASRCATAPLDRSIYEYSAACYYEKIYIQGGNLLDDARRRMGSTAFWAALRGYVAANQGRIVTTATLLHALDAGTSLDLGRTLFGPRFPRIY